MLNQKQINDLHGSGDATRLFRNEHSPGPFTPVHDIANEITSWGDTVRGRPEEQQALLKHVWSVVERYDDLAYLTYLEVAHRLANWWRDNEGRSA